MTSPSTQTGNSISGTASSGTWVSSGSAGLDEEPTVVLPPLPQQPVHNTAYRSAVMAAMGNGDTAAS